MAFSEEDKVVIKFVRKNKHYEAKQLNKDFPDRGCTLGGLKKLLRKIDLTGSSERRAGSGKPRTAREKEYIEQVQELQGRNYHWCSRCKAPGPTTSRGPLRNLFISLIYLII